MKYCYLYVLVLLACLFTITPEATSATSVSGTISANTTWSLAGSPYGLIGYTKVNYGVTLSIDPGVVVVGNGQVLQIFGTLNANGNSTSRIVFTNASLLPGTNTPQTCSIIARYAHFIDSKIFAQFCCAAIYASLTIEDSYIDNLIEPVWLHYPTADCSIKRNIFTGYEHGALTVNTHNTNKVIVKDNVFRTGGVLKTEASDDTSITIVTGNNFFQTDGYYGVLHLAAGSLTANIVATNNYWGTIDTNLINQMIWDKNDIPGLPNYIKYVPFLTAPNPDAPQVPLPTIQTQPQAQTASAGDTISFSVRAIGLGPITYQWKIDGNDLPGQTNSTLTLSNVQLSQIGDYSVLLRNFTGESVGSQDAHLSVSILPPVVLTHPTSQVALVSQSVTFSTAVSGTRPLYFQWRLNGTNISQATNATFTLTNVQTTNIGLYTMVVTNAAGVDISQPASLEVRYVLVNVDEVLVTNNTYTLTGTPAVTLTSGFMNGSIFYTTDGSEPTFESTFYTQSFTVNRTTTIRALAYSSDFSQSGLAPSLTVRILGYYNIFASSGGGGFVSINPPAGPYLEDSVVSVTAIPNPGWSFLQWGGDAECASNTVEISVTRNKLVKATFGTTFSTTVAGNGSISLDPLMAVYPYGTVVRVAAIPQPGNYFGVWGNATNGNSNPLYFTIITPNQTVSSLFASLPENKVALAVFPNGHGRVAISPQANSYSVGSIVTLSAISDAGESFVGWSGGASSNQNPLILTLNQSQIIQANFTKPLHLSLIFITNAIGTLEQCLNLDCDIGTISRFETSTNLATWNELTTVTNFSGSIQLSDPILTNSPIRFYRTTPH